VEEKVCLLGKVRREKCQLLKSQSVAFAKAKSNQLSARIKLHYVNVGIM